jgi:hypothetical protein
MFITNICTQYKHFECFNIRNDLFEMQEYFKDSKRIQCLSGRPMVHLQVPSDFITFWKKIQHFHNLSVFDSVENIVSAYEIQIYKESAEHHPRMASQYALAINRQVPELESTIAKDGRASVEYAIHVLKKRFCEGEYAIAKETEYSFEYAKYVICGPFPLGEKAIAKDADYSFLYAKYILKHRFILGEPTIFKDDYVRLAYTSQFNIVKH